MRYDFPLVCSSIFCLLVVTALDAQTVYTWKDASGTTHYSEHQPIAKAEIISLHQTVSTPPVERSTKKIQPTAASTLEKAKKDFCLKSCATARGNLKLLLAPGMVLDDGTVSQPAGVLSANKLSHAQRQTAKIQANKNIHSYCDRG